ncbi:MAG: hypothetical protein ACTSRG_13820 [Candidatus Helarchaeota archaeon]
MEKNSSNDRKINLVSVGIWACIAGFFAIVVMLALSGTNLGAEFVKLVYGFKNSVGPELSLFMIFLAVFLISIFGNLTVIFPVPYTIALGIIAIFPEFNIAVYPVNVILLSIFAGLGAGIGEVSAYLLGRGGAKTLEETSYGNSLSNLKSRIEKGWAIPLMFLFAATPIPDDPLLIVLGIVGYSLTRMTIVYVFGKIVFCLYITILIRVLIAIPGIQGTFALFGLDIQAIQIYDWFGIWISSVDPLTSAITWIGVLLFILALIFVDWKKLFRKIRGKNEEE